MPTPTDEQVDKVREIAGENDYALVQALIESRTDGQWTRALELITAWDTEYPAGESIGLQGGAQGIQWNPHTDAGLDIRTRMRLLLGLTETRSAGITGESGSMLLHTSFVW